MAHKKNPRRVDENSAIARLSMLKTSPRKLNLVAQMIRNKNVFDAISALKFCEKRIAHEVRKLLDSAIANAENNHGLDIDNLVVSEATVGREMIMKRIDIKGRSRRGVIKKPFSNMRIVVSQVGAN